MSNTHLPAILFSWSFSSVKACMFVGLNFLSLCVFCFVFFFPGLLDILSSLPFGKEFSCLHYFVGGCGRQMLRRCEADEVQQQVMQTCTAFGLHLWQEAGSPLEACCEQDFNFPLAELAPFVARFANKTGIPVGGRKFCSFLASHVWSAWGANKMLHGKCLSGEMPAQQDV